MGPDRHSVIKYSGLWNRNYTDLSSYRQFFYCFYIWAVCCATSRTVPGSIPVGFTWDFFRGSFRQNHVPWGWLSLWKWVPGISPGVEAAGVFGWWPTTLVVPKVEKIQGLNLPRTPRATLACRGIPLLFIFGLYNYQRSIPFGYLLHLLV